MYGNSGVEESAASKDMVLEHEELTDPPLGKVFTEGKLFLSAYFGGPLAAGYIISQNFKAFNEHDKAKKTMVITIACTIVIFAAIFAMPDYYLNKIPKSLIPATYTSVAWVLMKQHQDNLVKEHIRNGGAKVGWGKTVLLSILCLIITIAAIIAAALIFDILVGLPD